MSSVQGESAPVIFSVQHLADRCLLGALCICARGPRSLDCGPRSSAVCLSLTLLNVIVSIITSPMRNTFLKCIWQASLRCYSCVLPKFLALVKKFWLGGSPCHCLMGPGKGILVKIRMTVIEFWISVTACLWLGSWLAFCLIFLKIKPFKD